MTKKKTIDKEDEDKETTLEVGIHDLDDDADADDGGEEAAVPKDVEDEIVEDTTACDIVVVAKVVVLLSHPMLGHCFL